uniref:PH domain-containing protein n=1 Tax=Caenorhabditis tropicalis TaxID=1561998 RepID=A0A1I7UAE1_9PELO
MDCNGNISENPFLKQDNAAKRLIRRRPIIIRDTDTKKTDTGFRMKNSDIEGSPESPNNDLEYGPGIVEKLRAKFSKMSGAQKQQEKNSTVQTKKYSSCDDLLSESDAVGNVLKNSHAPTELQRRTSRSISDMLDHDEIGRPLISRNVELNQEEESKSISQLRRRFEKNGEQVTKMRFARDPVQLIAEFQPDHLDQWRSNIKLNKTPITHTNNSFIALSNKPTPVQRPIEVQSQVQHKASNVLKVLNDADTNKSEPEFVQIARRLRRYQPEIHDTTVSVNTTTTNSANSHVINNNNNINNNMHINNSPKPTTATSLPPTPTQAAPVRPATLSMWQSRQPEVPQYSEAAKIIRENCDIAVLPPDPHSARVSKQPIPSIGSENSRSNTPVEASPPPEEPKPNVLENYSQFRKTIVDISSDRTSAVNSVFKYDSSSPKSPVTNNLWKPTLNSLSMSSESTMSSPTASKLPFFSRKVDDVGAKSMISSSSANVVSISVKAPVSNRIYSNYDKTEDTTQESIRSTAPLKPPITYSPSYTSTSLNSVSLSSKYVEEKSKTSQVSQQQPINSMAPSNSLSGLLSPREKPYGDDVTILKSDESDDNSDGDSHDGNGSYDITPMRPNSLVFTRLANEEEMGGDGNVISRSLLSLVAEEDLPDFLVALNEKPIRYVVVEESEKPSTSSILRSKDIKREEKASKGTTRIRFCTENPMAYAYLDEYTATRSLQWDDGTVIEYSYFKDLEAAEEAALTHNDPTLALIEQWEQQIANDNIRPLTHDLTFSDSRLETSAVSSAY